MERATILCGVSEGQINLTDTRITTYPDISTKSSVTGNNSLLASGLLQANGLPPIGAAAVRVGGILSCGSSSVPEGPTPRTEIVARIHRTKVCELKRTTIVGGEAEIRFNLANTSVAKNVNILTDD